MTNTTLGTYNFENAGLLRTTNLSVDGAASETAIEYAVWTINPPGVFTGGDYTYSIEYSKNQLQAN